VFLGFPPVALGGRHEDGHGMDEGQQPCLIGVVDQRYCLLGMTFRIVPGPAAVFDISQSGQPGDDPRAGSPAGVAGHAHLEIAFCPDVIAGDHPQDPAGGQQFR